MTRLMPFLIFVLIAGGLAAYINKDRLFPQLAGATGAASTGGGHRGAGGRGGFGHGSGPVLISAEKARTDNVPVYLTGVGTVQAYNTATVRAQVSGRLTEVNFKEGQEVKKGDVLAKIDPVLYQAIYDQAVAKKAQDTAMLANARRDAQRYAGLAKSDYSSQQQADTAKSTAEQDQALVEQDQAAIESAKANLDYTEIKAPIDGRTGLRFVDPGNLVTSTDNTGIVVITQLRPIAVVFTLPENTVAEVLEAQKQGEVPLQTLSAGNTPIADGTLLSVDNEIDQTTGTVKIKGSFPNNRNHLWPGEFVNVKLRLKVLENAIVVPSLAVQQGSNGAYVYVVTPENTVKLTNVKVTQEGERDAVIAEGISAGDMVVTAGFTNLQDGTKVTLDTSAKPAGAPAQGAAASESSKSTHHHRKPAEAASGEAAAAVGPMTGSHEIKADPPAPKDLPNPPAAAHP